MVFEGRERIRLSDFLGEVVPDTKTEVGERVKAMSFAERARESGNSCTAAEVQKGKREQDQ